jgi:hypothetical protein
MKGFSPRVLPLALLALRAAVAGAQPVPPPLRPDFQVVRFGEDWSVLRRDSARGGLDALKYLPLSQGGSVYLSLGGQLRYREEGVRNFMLSPDEGRTDGFGLTRSLLHADLHAGGHLRLFVEGKHSVAHGRDLPGGRRTLDHDEWEVQNAFIDLTGGRLSARVGRQELLLGSQRLLSPLDWSNTRRTFDGARVWGQVRGLQVDGFWTRPVRIEVSAPNQADPQSTFWGVTARPASNRLPLQWEVYSLVLQQSDSVRVWGSPGPHSRFTLGGRATAPLTPATRMEVEGGWQGGSLGGRTISAWFLASDLSRTFATLPARPTATLGLDYASGDADPTDARVGTFHQLFPLGHAYAGHMDLLGRQNLIEARGVLSATLTPRLRARAAAHRFLRARSEDAAYNVAGGVLSAPSGVRARGVGSEVDLSATARLRRHLRVEAGYAHFAPAAFLLRALPGSRPSDWVYAATTFTF